MIIKGNQRGGGQALAAHLMNARDNDHVELHEVRGFLSNDLAGAFLEVEAAATATKCRQPFFSVILNPPTGHNATIEDFEAARDAVEAKFPALKGQPRALIFHEKEGRRHAHAIWDRINERGRAVQLSHSREKLKDVSRAMYVAMGIEAPAGIRDRTRADPLNYDIHTWQQAKRLGEDPRDLKKIIQDAWARSDSRAGFERALEQNALHLARGDKRGFVVVHHSGEAMSLTRFGEIGTRELKARLGDPEKLPTVDQVRTELFTKTTAVTARLNGEMVRRHREELRPLAAEHRQMKAAHREQRQTLDGNQTNRAGQEAQARAARLRKGVMGLWDRLSGKRGKVSELNARDMAAGRTRDRAERQTLIETQMQERGELQGRVMQMREQHRRDRQEHRAELGAMLSMAKVSVRDRFMEHGQELEARKRNPPTAAQNRRDRAEKTGTMPEIVASERTRRADARADREARKTGVEGREGGTGETAPQEPETTTAPPEAKQQQDSGQGQESTPEWTEAERNAAIEAEYERQTERDRSNDNDDPGRTFEP
jgi:predicted RNA methylase